MSKENELIVPLRVYIIIVLRIAVYVIMLLFSLHSCQSQRTHYCSIKVTFTRL